MTKLLIVDDSSEMRKLIRQVASKSCDEIFECEDGDEVVAAFDSHQPDWVLMDVEMKRVDGLKATATLMQLHPEAKVIIVTKHQDDMTRKAAVDAGARYFLGKDNLLTLRLLISGEFY
jgi:two-component system response regulator DegU